MGAPHNLEAVQRRFPRATASHTVPLTQVDFLVLEEVLLLGEALRALAALVRPLPGVDPLVPGEVGGVAEGLAAVRAPEDAWAASRVHAPVDDEGFLLGEELLALVAPVSPSQSVALLTRFVGATRLVPGFRVLVLPEAPPAHAGPVFHLDLLVLLLEEDLPVLRVLGAARRAVSLLLHHQHLLQTQALPTGGAGVGSLLGTVLPVEGDGADFAQATFPVSGRHQPARAQVSQGHGRAVLTIEGQRLAGTMENHLLCFPG